MIHQIHWQFRNGHTEMKTQFDLVDSLKNSERVLKLSQEIDYAKANFPIPDNAIWMMCNEKSRHFVGTIKPD